MPDRHRGLRFIPHIGPAQLQALGHNASIMPLAYVKPYVKRQKNDATVAEAIWETVARLNIRFVPTKTPEQQSGLLLVLRQVGDVRRDPSRLILAE